MDCFEQMKAWIKQHDTKPNRKRDHHEDKNTSIHARQHAYSPGGASLGDTNRTGHVPVV
jgi:hypothetical protein